MIIFKMSHAIIKRIIAICIFLLRWYFDNLNDLWNSALFKCVMSNWHKPGSTWASFFATESILIMYLSS